jgi:hypothetical protein
VAPTVVCHSMGGGGVAAAQVFGVPSFSAIPNQLAELPQTTDPLNARIRDILSTVRAERGRHVPVSPARRGRKPGQPEEASLNRGCCRICPPPRKLFVVKPKDPNELPFNRALVEDKVG